MHSKFYKWHSVRDVAPLVSFYGKYEAFVGIRELLLSQMMVTLFFIERRKDGRAVDMSINGGHLSTFGNSIWQIGIEEVYD